VAATAQKRAPGANSSPHDAQPGGAVLAPHVGQKRAPGGSSAEQAPHSRESFAAMPAVFARTAPRRSPFGILIATTFTIKVVR
jgi:hypothetical protein